MQAPQNTKAPSLPLPPVGYEQGYFNRLLDVFRQYFVSVDNFTSVLNSPTPYKVSQLGSARLGYRAIVTDATATTFGSVAVGGGANTVPVYYDGSNWRIG